MERKRRTFFRTFAAVLTGASIVPLSRNAFARQKAKTAFIHHVYFWLKNPDDKGEREIFEKALKELGSIESISLLHIGRPADTDRDVIDNTYHYSFLIGFKDRAGHDIYQEHPIHDKFRNEYAHMWTKVLVYDSVDI